MTAVRVEDLEFWKQGGLVPVVCQDAATGRVLMVAWADREAVEKTLKTRKMHFRSRSRGKLWRKGEESGNELDLVALRADCDLDTLLALVRPRGPACHTGRTDCFLAPLHGDLPASLLPALADTIEDRKRTPREGSWTTTLLTDENLRLKKVAEEAAELLLACRSGKREDVAHEAADVLYHSLVAAAAAGVPAGDVLGTLLDRHLAGTKTATRATRATAKVQAGRSRRKDARGGKRKK